MHRQDKNPHHRIARTATVLLTVAVAALGGCASTRTYSLPNGATAYEVQCTLWYQCTRKAREMCPRGYRLVKGPLRPRLPSPTGAPMQKPSRIDFVCR